MPAHWSPILVLLALILAANAVPALLGLLLGPARPIDGNHLSADHRPWLGASKTWRGLAAALLMTPLLAVVLGVPWWLGLAVAGGAMVGDLIASFIKRRMRLRSSTSVLLLDQLPESLIPAFLAKEPLQLTWPDIAVLAAAFTILDLVLTPLGKGVAGAFRRLNRL